MATSHRYRFNAAIATSRQSAVAGIDNHPRAMCRLIPGPIAWRIHPLRDLLAEMTPGAELGSILAGIDRERLSGPDRVMVMQAWNRQVAHVQAELYLSMMAVAEAEAAAIGDDSDPSVLYDMAASEIRAALTLTRRAADSQLDLATELVERHPKVWAALHAGEIDLPKTRVIV